MPCPRIDHVLGGNFTAPFLVYASLYVRTAGCGELLVFGADSVAGKASGRYSDNWTVKAPVKWLDTTETGLVLFYFIQRHS
jgi:hypothetical protein